MAHKDLPVVVIETEHRTTKNLEDAILCKEDGIASCQSGCPRKRRQILGEVGGTPTNITFTKTIRRVTKAASCGFLLSFHELGKDEIMLFIVGEHVGVCKVPLIAEK